MTGGFRPAPLGNFGQKKMSASSKALTIRYPGGGPCIEVRAQFFFSLRFRARLLFFHQFRAQFFFSQILRAQFFFITFRDLGCPSPNAIVALGPSAGGALPLRPGDTWGLCQK